MGNCRNYDCAQYYVATEPRVSPRQESNLHRLLRREPSYPLNDERLREGYHNRYTRCMHEKIRERNIFPAWSLNISETLQTLETTREGLSEDDARIRLRHFGANTLPHKARFTILGLLLRQFASPLIFILFGAALLSFFLSEWVEMWVIVIAISTNAGLGFYQEYRAENAIEKLTTYIRDRARVIRAGNEQEIDSPLLVPGDIIRLSYGSRVPADARVIEENELSVDEAVLTGGSLPVQTDTVDLS